MLPVSKLYRRLFLRGIWWDAQTAGMTLGEGLQAVAKARLKETEQGKILTGSTLAGASADFALPRNGQGMTPQHLAELVSWLLDLYDSTAEPGMTDGEIFAAMLDSIKPPRRRSVDFSR